MTSSGPSTLPLPIRLFPPRRGPVVSIQSTMSTGALNTVSLRQRMATTPFLLHLITSLKSKGKGAIILPHGVLFRGNKEADIRRNLIQRGFIKGIIGLPANLFYGTGIPACILVIDKENSHARTGIFYD